MPQRQLLLLSLLLLQYYGLVQLLLLPGDYLSLQVVQYFYCLCLLDLRGWGNLLFRPLLLVLRTLRLLFWHDLFPAFQGALRGEFLRRGAGSAGQVQIFRLLHERRRGSSAQLREVVIDLGLLLLIGDSRTPNCVLACQTLLECGPRFEGEALRFLRSLLVVSSLLRFSLLFLEPGLFSDEPQRGKHLLFWIVKI